MSEQLKATQEPETCANCKHNEWPFAMCDGCPKQSDESQTGNWEPKDNQPDYKALYEKAAQQYNDLADLMAEKKEQREAVAWVRGNRVSWRQRDISGLPDGTLLYPRHQAREQALEEAVAYQKAQAEKYFKLYNEVCETAQLRLKEIARLDGLLQARGQMTDEQFAAEWRRRVDEVAHGIK